MKKILTASLLLCGGYAQAQFAPQVPLEGNDAIFREDDRIAEWATGVTFERGLLDIADETSGYPTYGTEASALAYPDGDILSLGDGGHAIITFEHSIKNGAGPDFAIFENGFSDPLDASMAYLEFAFVAVSSDGINFVQFPATCNIPDTAQIDNFTYSDASLVNNLAGKYIARYGTPFDLEELKDIEGLDINNITHIKVTDVIGSIDPSTGSKDKDGNIINDPYPTVYPSGGFDLDAVGVLNSNKPLSIHALADKINLNVYPNPSTDIVNVVFTGAKKTGYQLMDITGKTLMGAEIHSGSQINVGYLSAGMYLLEIVQGKEKAIIKIAKK